MTGTSMALRTGCQLGKTTNKGMIGRCLAMLIMKLSTGHACAAF